MQSQPTTTEYDSVQWFDKLARIFPSCNCLHHPGCEKCLGSVRVRKELANLAGIHAAVAEARYEDGLAKNRHTLGAECKQVAI